MRSAGAHFEPIDQGKARTMNTEFKQKAAFRLSVIIVGLAAIASAGGLLLGGLYRDNEWVKLSWPGNDFVTLVIAIPIMISAMVSARRGSKRAELIWLGMLDYMLYNYAYYLFGAAFNWFFLIYVALFALSLFAIFIGLFNVDAADIGGRFRARTPVRWISGYMLLVGIGLSTVYFLDSLNYILTGVVPEIIELAEHPTNLIFALDLSLLVPVLLLGGIWLWKRQPWGYVLAGIGLVKGATYTLVLTAIAIWSTMKGLPDSAGEIPVWAIFTVAGTVAALLLYGNLESKPGVSPARTEA